MGKKNLIHSALMQVAVLLPSVFCALFGVAQTSLKDSLIFAIESQDINLALKRYYEVSKTDIKQLSDSTLFYYHYLGAYINYELLPDNEKNYEKALSHFLEAKQLCETSIGVHSGDYMEIMRGLGDTYIELGQCEEASNIYQEGIVKSMYARDVASAHFGNLIMGLQSCYEQLGWFGEIPSHLQDAWIFWGKDFEPFETYNYYPLWALQQFYRHYGMNEQALVVSDQIIDFISAQTGDNHPVMADALYWRGNLFVDMNRLNDGIETYKKGIILLRDNGLDNKLYKSLTENLYMALISAELFEESDVILDSIHNYSITTGESDFYKNALFSAANRLCNMGNYAKAISYNKELFNLNITDEERPVIENQRNTILYNQEVVENLSALENTFASLPIGQDDWFETGHKLSNAYYILKAVDKNLDVLKKMYQAIDTNKSIGVDYYSWTLYNLYGVSLDKELYQDALRYAIEKNDYISTLSDVPDNYRYNTINDLVVAKMKSNTLNGIDSDLENIEKFYRNQYGVVSSEYATYLHNRGRAYQLQNKLEEAKATLLKSITIQNKVEGKPLDRTVKYYLEVEQQLGEL